MGRAVLQQAHADISRDDDFDALIQMLFGGIYVSDRQTISKFCAIEEFVRRLGERQKAIEHGHVVSSLPGTLNKAAVLLGTRRRRQLEMN
jgi:hypothetical protein